MARSRARSRAGSRQGSRAGGAGGPAGSVRRLCLGLARDLRTALDRELAAFGLRTQQAAVLLRCCRERSANPSLLAKAVGTDTAGVTGLLDQLEKRGLVSRRLGQVDRRLVVVEPTELGWALAPALREVFEAVDEVLLQDFSPQAAAALDSMLVRLRANVQARLDETAEVPVPARRRQGPARRPRKPRSGA